MIARRFTPEQLAALAVGQRVVHLVGGGTNWREVVFLGAIPGTDRALVQADGFPVSRVKLSGLGPLEGRIEEAIS